jgi:hypothetical protein
LQVGSSGIAGTHFQRNNVRVYPCHSAGGKGSRYSINCLQWCGAGFRVRCQN